MAAFMPVTVKAKGKMEQALCGVLVNLTQPLDGTEGEAALPIWVGKGRVGRLIRVAATRIPPLMDFLQASGMTTHFLTGMAVLELMTMEMITLSELTT